MRHLLTWSLNCNLSWLRAARNDCDAAEPQPGGVCFSTCLQTQVAAWSLWFTQRLLAWGHFMSTLTCPLCNAQFLFGEPVAGQRIACPRCGDTFLFRPQYVVTTGDTAPMAAFGLQDLSVPASPESVDPAPNQPKFSNRSLGLLVLGGMSVMAGLGLIFMLLTEDERRSHDTIKPPRYEVISIPLLSRLLLSGYMLGLAFFIGREPLTRKSPRTSAPSLGKARLAMAVVLVLLAIVLPFMLRTRPAPISPDDELVPISEAPAGQLAGLGYLPPDIAAVAAVRIAELMQTTAGRDMLELEKLRLGPTDLGIARFAGWLGVKPEELDHIVLGLSSTDQWYLVIRTRKPYDQERVLKPAMKDPLIREVRKLDDAGALPLYLCDFVAIQKLSLQPTLWLADKRTLVLFFFKVKPDEVKLFHPDPNGSQHFTNPMRDFLGEENGLLGKGQLWLAGSGDSLKNALLELALPADYRPLLKNLSVFAVWTEIVDADLSVTWVLDYADEKAAKTVEQKLAALAKAGEVERTGPRLLWKHTTTADKVREGFKTAPAGSGKKD
jgi:hypothetical protein